MGGQSRHAPEGAESRDALLAEDRSKQPYLAPEIIVVGRTEELVLSGSSGKYSDGYTGYYWER